MGTSSNNSSNKSSYEYKYSSQMLNLGVEEFSNGNYNSSLYYFLQSNKSDSNTYHNISLCYYNIGINLKNTSTIQGYKKAIASFNKCLNYANSIEIINLANEKIKNCKANINYLYANENFKNRNYDLAITNYNIAKKLFESNEDINICNNNIGVCFFNIGNNYFNLGKSIKDYQNAIDQYKNAKKYYNSANDKNNCNYNINKCLANIYQLEADNNSNINLKIYLIDQAINVWPENIFGKNKFLYNKKSRFLYKYGIDKYNSGDYNEAQIYFQQSYEVCTYQFNSDDAILIRNMIECCNIRKIEKKALDNINNSNFQEAYNLFSEALSRAKKIKKTNLIDHLTKGLNSTKILIETLKNLELEQLKREKEEKERKLQKIKKQKEEEEIRRRKEMERLQRIKDEERERKIEEMRRKLEEELERKKKEKLEKEESERQFREEQLKQSQKEYEDLILYYLNEKCHTLINLYIRDSKLCNNNKIKNQLISNIKNINFNNEIKVKTQIKDIKQYFYSTLNNDSINHLNIILVGPSGVGKSTLINTLLQFNNENELKTQVGASCTMGKPRYYESPYFKYLRLADSRGIEKNKNYGINEVFKDISEFIKEQEINGNPDKFVHCIWYCITDSRFEDIEIENVRKLSTIYGNNGNLPVIIVFTKAIYSEFYKGLEKKVQQNNLNMDIVPIISKPFFNQNDDDEFFSIPTKGLKKLISLTVENCKKGIENAGISSINEKIKLELFKNLDEIKRNIELLLNNFSEMESINHMTLYNLNNELKNEYEKILINPNIIDINLSNFFEDIIIIEGEEKIDSLINYQIDEIMQYLLEQQLILYNKYNTNFNINKDKNSLKLEVINFLKNQIIVQKEFYNICNYIEYYKIIGLPIIFSNIKEIYKNFFNSYEFLSIMPESNCQNYKVLSENIKKESENLEEKLKKEFEMKKNEWEKNNEISLKKEEELKEKEKKSEKEKNQKIDKYKSEDDEIYALFGISPFNINKTKDEDKQKQTVLNINDKNENISNENKESEIEDKNNIEIQNNEIKFYNIKGDNKNIKKSSSIDKINSYNKNKKNVKIKFIKYKKKNNKEDNLKEKLNVNIKLKYNSYDNNKFLNINNKNNNNQQEKKINKLNIAQNNFIHTIKIINIESEKKAMKKNPFILEKKN